MEFYGLEIDECTCTFAIKACTYLLDYEYGMGVVEKVLDRGTGGNVFLGSSVINFLVKFDHVDEARRLFDGMRRKDVVSWNTMIRGYVKTGCFEEAVKLFLDMRGYGTMPTSVTMLCLIQALEGIGNAVLGKCAHGCVLELGLREDVMVLTALVNMYGKIGDIRSSSSVFDMIERKSLVSWNAIISAYIQNGRVTDSFTLFQRLIYTGLDFDSVTIVSLLQGCSQISDLNMGKILHGVILRRKCFDLNVILMTSLLALYSKCGALELAKYIFAHMKEKNVVTWTALLVGLAQNGHAEDALRLFCRMQVEGVPPNSVTLVSLIHSCAHLGSLRKGKSVHARLLRGGFSLDDISMTALLDMYSKCGKINYAEKIFSYCWISKDVVLWNSMISCYGLHGNGHQAINLLSRMIDEGVKPNETTFLSLLVACSHSGMVEEGIDLFDKMEPVYNIRPLDKHYACCVDILSRAGRLDEAQAFIAKMPFDPQSDVLESMMNGCRFYKNIDIGVKIADKLLALDSVNPGIYIVLSNIYAEVKKWDEVNYVRDLMRNRAVKKTPGYSVIEIGNLDHTFFAGDDSHPEWDKVNQLLKTLRVAAEASGYVADTSCVLRDVDEQKKVSLLWGHSERLAISLGLLHTPPGSVIRIRKNLRVCNDCHNVTKIISKLVQREIVVRDANRFHHFVDGRCSCRDYW
ncbi:hypothetical protein LIER_04592 [Lithospermum erythrorhizon]|uniref:DYW domain-containing protein n=1 Tax=Lithospermum erythrorhizon TaxID=34254 RepID=A0AAV3P1G2_LITER